MIVDICISTAVALMLSQKHGVTELEVRQCFYNREGKFAYDTREEHKTHPPTLWFIAETDAGRRLKVVFQRYNNTEYVIKSAYEPNAEEERLYQMYKQLR